MIRKPFITSLLCAACATLFAPATSVQANPVASAAAASNSVQSWTSATEPDGATTLAIKFEKAFDGNMASFTGPNGDYITFDFPGYVVGEMARNVGIAQGLVKSVRFVETGKRLRAIVQIEKGANHKAFVQDGLLIVRLSNNPSIPLEAKPVIIPPMANVALPSQTAAPVVSMPSQQGISASTVRASAPTVTAAPQANLNAGPSTTVVTQTAVSGNGALLRDIEYKKTGNDMGQLNLDLSNSVKVKIYREGSNLAIELPDTAIPRNLLKRLRVENMDTPVVAITPQSPREGFTKLLVEIRGGWDYTFVQNSGAISVDIFKIGDDYKVGGKKVFNGKKLTLSFQQIDVRTVLQILAEFTGMNIIASDTVQGNITLRLNEVPWDQALDIILSSRNLDMRRNGQVLWIAPRAEIAEKEKQEFSDRKALEGLKPMVTETFQLNYQKALDIQVLLAPAAQSGAPTTEKGSIKVDPRTNQIFVRDTTDRVEEIRQIIKKVDIPVRQVTIEAKIVEVNDSFTKNVGVKFGLDGATLRAGSAGGLMLGSSAAANAAFIGGVTPASPSLNVNLPGSGINGASAGSFAFTIFNSSLTRLLNLEVSALEADGKAKTVSSPRVVTSDGKEASIEQGVEIPYLQASSSGAANVSFKKASMSLKVVPQITPDGRVNLELQVNKDGVGQNTSAGPAINTKQVKTGVLVENGGTIVIGGIFEVSDSTTVNKVPVLGDIPVVGNAFKNNSKEVVKREMVIMITPRIIESSNQ